MRLWAAARVPAARHSFTPTKSWGEPASSTTQTGRTNNPYCLAACGSRRAEAPGVMGGSDDEVRVAAPQGTFETGDRRFLRSHLVERMFASVVVGCLTWAWYELAPLSPADRRLARQAPRFAPERPLSGRGLTRGSVLLGPGRAHPRPTGDTTWAKTTQTDPAVGSSPTSGHWPTARGRRSHTPRHADRQAWRSSASNGPCPTRRSRRRSRPSAPRGALLYPRLSREELEGRFLGPMAYPDLKGERDSSMPLKRWSAQAPGLGCRGTRVIWRKLDCLNPNLQTMQRSVCRKDACDRHHALRQFFSLAVATFGVWSVAQ